MSFSVTETVSNIGGDPPVITISTDAKAWNSDDVVELAEKYSSYGSIQVENLYQFQAIPLAIATIKIAQEVGIDFLANLIADLLKGTPRKDVILDIQIKRTGDRDISGILIKGANTKLVDKALGAIPSILQESVQPIVVFAHEDWEDD